LSLVDPYPVGGRLAHPSAPPKQTLLNFGCLPAAGRPHPFGF
jgi:hypothetical protein